MFLKFDPENGPELEGGFLASVGGLEKGRHGSSEVLPAVCHARTCVEFGIRGTVPIFKGQGMQGLNPD